MSITPMIPGINQFSQLFVPGHPTVNLFPDSLKSCEKEIKKSLSARGLRILQDPIGMGAQGTVYAVADVSTGKVSHVLKTLRPDAYEPEKGSHLVTNIKHPGICSPTEFFYVTNFTTLSSIPTTRSWCIAMIMPHVEGSTYAKQRIKIEQKADLIFHFGLLLSEAVHELSKNKISHEDLHSRNIMIDRNLNPVIIDFDYSAKQDSVSSEDYSNLRNHLICLIRDSLDINPRAAQFILACLDKCDPYGKKLPELPALMISFMQACIEHLDEIKPKSKL